MREGLFFLGIERSCWHQRGKRVERRRVTKTDFVQGMPRDREEGPGREHQDL